MTPTVRTLRRVFSIAYMGLSLAAIGVILGMILFFGALRDLPRVPDPLNRIIETPPTEIFAVTGERLMLIGGRQAVPLSRVSASFVNAVIATEDHRFWEHHGVDKLRTVKAQWVTLFKPGQVQGASTITQQLAKNLFFSFQRTYLRKFRELLVALQIEARYGKREILEAYLNQIPFGVGAYGIEQAAQSFFGKPASELNLAESALLAGLPKSPTRYNPYLHFDRARERQRVVLSRMAMVGFITAADAETAARAQLDLRPKTAEERSGSYFIDLVVRGLEERYGPDVVYHGGLKISTTLDPQLQTWAQESIQAGLTKLDLLLGIATPPKTGADPASHHPQGALVAIEANSGAVRALVGGRDYAETEYNRAIQNRRLPGSGFKPFLYYTALEKLNVSPATVFVDRKIKIPVAGAPDWSPLNFGKAYEGPMILKRALTNSVNSIAAQLVKRTGPEAVIETARSCGIRSPLKSVYSVVLGTSGVSPLEMASAFATFANGGVQHEPFWIRRIEDPFGRILEEKIVSGTRRLDESITYQLVDMMRGVVDEGTGMSIRRLGFDLPAAGKTGTTDDYRDAWFTGFTPNLSVSVWVGFDRGGGMRDTRKVGVTGGRAAAPIWADFMKKATAGEPLRDFPVPADIQFVKVNPVTGVAANDPAAGPVAVALRSRQTGTAPEFTQSTTITVEDLPPPKSK